MKIVLVGHPGSQVIVPASQYLTSKYLPGFEIIYLNYTGHINGWAGYLADYFSKMDDERVIFALDDYLIASPINMKAYRDAESYLNSPEVCCVKLCKSTIQEHREYPCTTQYSIWNRLDLIEILKQVRTPWEFEIEGSKRMRKASVLETCINYFANSSLSARWDGINLQGLGQEDIKYMRETGLLNTNMQNNKTKNILVTGGSGYLGQALIARLISQGDTNIISVSRNEGAAVSLKEKYPQVKIIIGDIADPWVIKKAMQGVDEVYHLAALKHVGVAENDVKECVDSNIVGTMNIVNESLITKPDVLVFVSSDKAAQPNGVYGCSKKIGEKLVSEAERINPDTKYRCVRYGNVWMSTFSIGPKWKPKMQRGEEIILTDPEASRFFWEVGEAVDLIFKSIDDAFDSNPLVPKMKAVKMGTVLEACMEVWGTSPVKIIGLQPGENKVETTDGIIFSDNCEQFTKEEFIKTFLSNE